MFISFIVLISLYTQMAFLKNYINLRYSVHKKILVLFRKHNFSDKSIFHKFDIFVTQILKLCEIFDFPDLFEN